MRELAREDVRIRMNRHVAQSAHAHCQQSLEARRQTRIRHWRKVRFLRGAKLQRDLCAIAVFLAEGTDPFGIRGNRTSCEWAGLSCLRDHGHAQGDKRWELRAWRTVFPKMRSHPFEAKPALHVLDNHRKCSPYSTISKAVLVRPRTLEGKGSEIVAATRPGTLAEWKTVALAGRRRSHSVQLTQTRRM